MVAPRREVSAGVAATPPPSSECGNLGVHTCGNLGVLLHTVVTNWPRTDATVVPRWWFALSLAAIAGCQVDLEPQPGHAIVFGTVVLGNGDPAPNVPVGYSESFVSCDAVPTPDAFPARTTAGGNYRIVMTSGTGASCVVVATLRNASGRTDTVTVVAASRVVFRSGAEPYDSVRADIRLP